MITRNSNPVRQFCDRLIKLSSSSRCASDHNFTLWKFTRKIQSDEIGFATAQHQLRPAPHAPIHRPPPNRWGQPCRPSWTPRFRQRLLKMWTFRFKINPVRYVVVFFIWSFWIRIHWILSSTGHSSSIRRPFLIDLLLRLFLQVCMEPSAGYHFGNFTCEGCKVSSNR